MGTTQLHIPQIFSTYTVGGEDNWKAQSMAELTPHPFLFSCCVFQPLAGSQVSAQEGQGSPSAVSDSLPFDPWYRELAWMETLLSPELDGDLVLRVRTKLGDHPLRSSTGSTKAESLVSSTDLGCTPSLCMCLLGSGKRSILLTQMERKEWLSSWALLGGFLSHCPHAHSHPKGVLVSQEAHWSSWLRPPIRMPFEVGASVAMSGLWWIRGRLPGSPLLTLCLLEPPGEVFYAHVLELEQVLQASHLHLQDLGQATQKSSPVACCTLSIFPGLNPPAPSQCAFTCTVSCEANSSCSFSAIWRMKLGSLCSAWLYPGGWGTGSRPSLG